MFSLSGVSAEKGNGLLCVLWVSNERSEWAVNDYEELLKNNRDTVIAIAAKHGARQPRVFGSMARGEAGPRSDIDLLVKMDEGRSLLDLSALVLELQDLLGVKVDVVSEDGLYWLLRRRILKEARPL